MGNFIESLHHLNGKQIIDQKISDLKINDLYEFLDLFRKQYHNDGYSIQKDHFVQIFPSIDDIFVKWVQDETKKELDALEIFSGLVIFSDASFYQKIKFLYQIFNLNEGPYIQRIELEFLLNEVIHATFKIYSMKCNVNEAIIQQFLNLSFQVKEEIPFQKFYYWAKRTPEITQFMEILQKSQPYKPQLQFRISPINSEYLPYDRGSPFYIKQQLEQLNNQSETYFQYFQNQQQKNSIYKNPLKTSAQNLNNVFKNSYQKNIKLENIFHSRQFEQIRNALLQSYQSLIVSSQFHSDYSQMKQDINVEKSWVYGFKSSGIYKPIHFMINDELQNIIAEKIIYFTGSTAILYCTVQEKQEYYSLHDDEIISLSLSQNGLLIATGENGKFPDIHLWCPSTLKNISIISTQHTNGVQYLEFIQNDKLLVTGGLSDKSQILVYEICSSQVIYSTCINDMILGLNVIFNYVDIEDDTSQIFSNDNVSQQSQQQQQSSSNQNQSSKQSNVSIVLNNNNNNLKSPQKKLKLNNNNIKDTSIMSGQKSLLSSQQKKKQEEQTHFFNFQNAFLILQEEKIQIFLFLNNNFIITQLKLEEEDGHSIQEKFKCFTSYRISISSEDNNNDQEEEDDNNNSDYENNNNNQISEEESHNSKFTSSKNISSSKQSSSSSSTKQQQQDSQNKSTKQSKSNNNHNLVILTGHANGIICKWVNFQFVSQKQLDPKDDITHTCSFNQGIIICTEHMIYLMDYHIEIQFQKFSIKDLNIHLISKHINSIQGFYERIFLTTKGGDLLQLDFDEQGNLIQQERINKIIKLYGQNSYMHPTPYMNQEEYEKEKNYYNSSNNFHFHHTNYHSHHNNNNASSPANNKQQQNQEQSKISKQSGNHHSHKHHHKTQQQYTPNDVYHKLYTVSEQGVVQVINTKDRIIDNIFYFHKKYHQEMLEPDTNANANNKNKQQQQQNMENSSNNTSLRTVNSNSPKRKDTQKITKLNLQNSYKLPVQRQNSPRKLNGSQLLKEQIKLKQQQRNSQQNSPSSASNNQNNSKNNIHITETNNNNKQSQQMSRFNKKYNTINNQDQRSNSSSRSNKSRNTQQQYNKSNTSFNKSSFIDSPLSKQQDEDTILENNKNPHYLLDRYSNSQEPHSSNHINSSHDITKSFEALNSHNNTPSHQHHLQKNTSKYKKKHQNNHNNHHHPHHHKNNNLHQQLKITAFTRNSIDQETKKYIAMGFIEEIIQNEFQQIKRQKIVLKVRRWIKRKITNKDKNHKESFKTFDILDEKYDKIKKKITHLQFSEDGLVLLVLTEEEQIYAFQYYQESFFQIEPKIVNLSSSHHQNSIPVHLDFYDQHSFLVSVQSGKHFYKVDLNLKSRNLSSIEKINLPRMHLSLLHESLGNQDKIIQEQTDLDLQRIYSEEQENDCINDSNNFTNQQQQFPQLFMQTSRSENPQLHQQQFSNYPPQNQYNTNLQQQQLQQQQQTNQQQYYQQQQLQESKVVLGDLGVQVCSVSNKIFYFKDRNFVYNNCGNCLKGHSSEIRHIYFKDPHTFISLGKSDGTIIEWKIQTEKSPDLIQPFFGPHEGQKLNSQITSFPFLKNLNDETLISEQLFSYKFQADNQSTQTKFLSQDSHIYYPGIQNLQLLQLYSPQLLSTLQSTFKGKDNLSSLFPNNKQQQTHKLQEQMQKIRQSTKAQTEHLKIQRQQSIVKPQEKDVKQQFFQDALFLDIQHVNGFSSSQVRNSVVYAHDTFSPYYKQHNLYKIMVQEKDATYLPPKTPKSDLKKYLDILDTPELILSQSDSLLKSLNKYTEQTEFYEVNDLPYLICHNNCNRLLIYFTSRLFIIKNPVSNIQNYYSQHQQDITCFDIHPLNKTIIASTEQQSIFPQIHIWNALLPQNSKKIIQTMHKNSIVIMRFDSDGDNLISVSCDYFHSIQVTNWRSKQIISFRNTSQYPIFDLICNPQNSQEFTTGSIKNITVWEVKNSQIVKKLMVNTDQQTHIVECITCISYLNYLLDDEVKSEIVAGNNRGQILFLAEETLVVAKDNAHQDKMINVMKIYEIFQEQTVIITAGEDETIKIWNVSFSLLSELNLRELQLFDKVPINFCNLSVQSLDLFMCQRSDLQYKNISVYTYDPILLVGLRSGVILEAQFKISIKTLKQQFEIKLKEQKRLQKLKNTQQHLQTPKNNSQQDNSFSKSISDSTESDYYSSDEDEEDDDGQKIEKAIKVGWLTPDHFKFHFSLVLSSHSSQEFEEKKQKKKVFLCLLENLKLTISTGDDKLILIQDLTTNNEIFREYLQNRATCITHLNEQYLFIGDTEGTVNIFEMDIQNINGIVSINYFKPLLELEFDSSLNPQKSQVINIAISKNEQFLAISYDSQRQQKEVSETSQTHLYEIQDIKLASFKKLKDLPCLSYNEMKKEEATQVGVYKMNFTDDSLFLILYYQDIFNNLYRNNAETNGQYRIWNIEAEKFVPLKSWFLDNQNFDINNAPYIKNLDYSTNLDVFYNYFSKLEKVLDTDQNNKQKNPTTSMNTLQQQYQIFLPPLQTLQTKEQRLILSSLKSFQNTHLILGSSQGDLLTLNQILDNYLKEGYLIHTKKQLQKKQSIIYNLQQQQQQQQQQQNLQQSTNNEDPLLQSILGLSASRPRNFPKSSLAQQQQSQQQQQQQQQQQKDAIHTSQTQQTQQSQQQQQQQQLQQSQQQGLMMFNSQSQQQQQNPSLIRQKIESDILKQQQQQPQQQMHTHPDQSNSVNIPFLQFQQNQQLMKEEQEAWLKEQDNMDIYQQCIQQPKGHSSFVNQIIQFTKQSSATSINLIANNNKENNPKTFIFTTGISDENIIKWELSVQQIKQVCSLHQVLQKNTLYYANSSPLSSMISSSLSNSKKKVYTEIQESDDDEDNNNNIYQNNLQDQIKEIQENNKDNNNDYDFDNLKTYNSEDQTQEDKFDKEHPCLYYLQKSSQNLTNYIDSPNYDPTNLYYLQQQRQRLLPQIDYTLQDQTLQNLHPEFAYQNLNQISLQPNTIVGRSALFYKHNLLYDKDDQIMYVSGCNIVVKDVPQEQEHRNSFFNSSQQSIQQQSRSQSLIQQQKEKQIAQIFSNQASPNNKNKTQNLNQNLLKRISSYSAASSPANKLNKQSSSQSDSINSSILPSSDNNNKQRNNQHQQQQQLPEKILTLFPDSSFHHPQQISCIKQSKDHQLFILGTSQKNARIILYNLSALIFLGQITLKNIFTIQNIAISQNKQYIAVLGLQLNFSQKLYFIDLNSLQILAFYTFPPQEQERWKALEFDPFIDTKFVLAGNHSIYKYEYTCNRLLFRVMNFQYKNILSLEQLERICFTTLLYISEILLIGDSQGSINIESTQKQSHIAKRIQIHQSPITGLVPMQEVESHFTSSSKDGKISIYELLQNCKNKELFSFLHIYTYDIKQYYNSHILQAGQQILYQQQNQQLHDQNFEIQSLYDGGFILVGTKSGDIYELDKVYDSEEGQNIDQNEQDKLKLYNFVQKAYDNLHFDLIQFSQNSQLLYCISNQGYLLGYHIKNRKEIFGLQLQNTVLDITYLKSQNLYLFQGEKTISFFKVLQDGALQQVEQAQKDFHSEISKVHFSQDESYLVVAIKKFERIKPQIKIFKFKQDSESIYEFLNQIENLPKTVRHIQFSHDNQYFNFDESEKELGYYNLKNQFLWINPMLKDVENIKWEHKQQHKQLNKSSTHSYNQQYNHLQHLTLQHYKQIFYHKFKHLYQRDKVQIYQIILLPYNYYTVTDNTGCIRLFQKLKVFKNQNQQLQQQQSMESSPNSSSQQSQTSILKSPFENHLQQQQQDEIIKQKQEQKNQECTYEFILIETFTHQMLDISVCLLSPNKKYLVTQSQTDKSITIFDIKYKDYPFKDKNFENSQNSSTLLDQEGIDKSFSLVRNSRESLHSSSQYSESSSSNGSGNSNNNNNSLLKAKNNQDNNNNNNK